MNTETLNLPTETGKSRNNSTLSYVDCCMRLVDWNRPFEEMSNDDLDSLYFVAFKRWAYHLTRQAYIDYLNKYRKEHCDTFLATVAQEFIDWRDKLHSEMRGGKLMFDVPKHYKWLDESELFTYYMDIGR